MYPGNPAPAPVKRKKPWYKRFWVWLLIVVAFIVVVVNINHGGSASTAPAASQSAASSAAGQPATAQAAPESSKAAPASKAQDKLTLDDGWTLDKSNQFAAYVNGYVTNNTDKPINDYVQITFDALDAQGANLGTCLANTNTIDAHGKWKFQALCSGSADEVATVRLKEISGF
ncbi:FxLYD domain-containing protein [Propionibacterium cyclohexanicum]